METVDQEFTDAALDFTGRTQRDEKPFFVWFNATRMHNWIRLAPRWEGGFRVPAMIRWPGVVLRTPRSLVQQRLANVGE